ncbi:MULTISPECIES: hypothetical protein [unclassified Pseudoalteromonas]|nr:MULTISPECIES: hypothetical protein [unclassified Pseudoalteromonas]MDN3380818.1 hypothetical protein [Pseudoalteromonas sp. APC 3893]MDN3389204.1 hypothetical protein [Pseudoalteromonas sp. APC 4017]
MNKLLAMKLSFFEQTWYNATERLDFSEISERYLRTFSFALP